MNLEENVKLVFVKSRFLLGGIISVLVQYREGTHMKDEQKYWKRVDRIL